MQKIKSILTKISPSITFLESDDYIQSGTLDSLDIIGITAELEKEFGINIPGTLITPENFKNLDAIVGLVKQTGGKL
jgi:acyl carrier protein